MDALKPGLLIVDGYNIIGAWRDLAELKRAALGSARDQLVNMLAAYLPWCWERIIVVFDGREAVWEDIDGVEVVYSKDGQTADTLIERLAAGLAAGYRVEVATSDHAEHRAASGLGAAVLTAAALKERLEEERESYRRVTARVRKRGPMLTEFLDDSSREKLKKWGYTPQGKLS